MTPPTPPPPSPTPVPPTPVIGFHASHEQFGPDRLLNLVQLAERAGFDAAMCSDHFAPFSAAQGQAESLAASFTVVESKLNAGTANMFEYSLAKAKVSGLFV